MTATAKQIDWTKPVQARCGCGEWRDVRVLATDLPGEQCVAIFIDVSNGGYMLGRKIIDGRGNAWEIRNTPAPPVPFEVKRWFNIYRSGGMFLIDSYYDTEECARSRARRNSLETVTVPVTIRGEWKEENGNG